MMEFCATHALFAEGYCAGPSIASDFPEYGRSLDELLRAFIESTGSQVYATHVQSGMMDWVQRIQDDCVALEIISADSIAVVPLGKLLEQVIRRPNPDVLANEPCFNSDSDEMLVVDTSGKRSRSALALLRDFSETLDLHTISYQAQNPSDASFCGVHNAPTEQVITCLSLVCLTREVSEAACAVRQLLIQALALAPATVDKSDKILTNKVAPLMAFLMQNLAALKNTMRSEETIEIERNKVNQLLPASVATIGHWASAMDHVVGRLQREALQQLCNGVDVAAAACRGKLPLWQSCITEEEIKVDMAIKLLGKASAATIKCHNELHDKVTCMAKAAALMQVTPDIQDNPISSSSIAIARKTIGDAKTCTVIANAVAILQQRDQVDGALLAAAFVKTHDDNKAGVVPRPLWGEVCGIAAYADMIQDCGKMLSRKPVASGSLPTSSRHDSHPSRRNLLRKAFIIL